jgi:hypothetical protein
VRTVVYVVTAAAAWSVFVYKALELRRNDNPFRRSFCALAALMAMAFTMGAPPIIGRLEHATGLLAAWSLCFVVLSGAAVHATLLLWTYPADEAWRRIRPRWWFYGLAATAMLILCLVGRVSPDGVPAGANAEIPERIYGRTPFVADAMLIYVVALGYATVDGTRLLWRSVRSVDRRWLRRCLRLLTVSGIINCVSCASLVVFISGLRVGLDLEAAQRAHTALAGLGVTVGAVGATLPKLGPRLDRLVACHRLHPLWLALYRANPDVVLDPPRLMWIDRWKPWGVDLRLYRRIIEIRDSRLALRPYMDPALAARIRSEAERGGATGEELDASVEAAVLAAAIDAKLSGGCRRPAEVTPVDDPNPGHDLAAETAWFTRVAEAFVRPTATGLWRAQVPVHTS